MEGQTQTLTLTLTLTLTRWAAGFGTATQHVRPHPYVMEAANICHGGCNHMLCHGGCNHMSWRLQPDVHEAATTCLSTRYLAITPLPPGAAAGGPCAQHADAGYAPRGLTLTPTLALNLTLAPTLAPTPTRVLTLIVTNPDPAPNSSPNCNPSPPYPYP